jgi:hypothetical protein
LQKIPLWFLLGVFLLTSCNMPISPAGDTSVWFDVPLNGLSVPVNSPVHIEGHAASSAGVLKVNIWVNDDLLTSVENPPAKDNLSYFEATWIPASTGEYILSASAVSKNGLSSQTDKVKIIVNGGDGTITLTISPPLISISPSVTVTPEVSLTPTLTPTVTASITPTKPPPPTKTFTPPPPPPDTQAPPAPSEFSPNGTKLPCMGAVTLKWNAVSDKSGISGYKLEIAQSSNGKSWQPHPTSPMAGTKSNSFKMKVECGWHYRWRVLAIDGKGNQSPFSNWAQFSVVLN